MFVYCFFPVEGVSLGLWIWERKKNKQPIKLPINVTENDGPEQTTIKLLVQRMVCPEPSYRIPITEIFHSLNGE